MTNRTFSLFISIAIVLIALVTSCVDPGKTKNPDKVVESMATALAKKNSNMPYHTVDDVKEMQDLVIIDVREKFERDISVIPGSISKAEFEANKKKYIQYNVVVHCTIGFRSTEYAKSLIPEGFIVSVLKGGILGWIHAGQAIIDKEGKETKKVHVFTEAWNLVPKGYESIF